MKIKRIIKIKLTNAEIEQAYRERKLEYYAEDVKCRWQEMYGDDDAPFPYGDDVAKRIAERAADIMDKNDGYQDYYWANFEAAIKEFENEES